MVCAGVLNVGRKLWCGRVDQRATCHYIAETLGPYPFVSHSPKVVLSDPSNKQYQMIFHLKTLVPYAVKGKDHNLSWPAH